MLSRLSPEARRRVGDELRARVELAQWATSADVVQGDVRLKEAIYRAIFAGFPFAYEEAARLDGQDAPPSDRSTGSAESNGVEPGPGEVRVLATFGGGNLSAEDFSQCRARAENMGLRYVGDEGGYVGVLGRVQAGELRAYLRRKDPTNGDVEFLEAGGEAE